MRTVAAAAALAVLAAPAACDTKPAKPKVESKVIDTRALDTARGLQADLDRKAREDLETADKLSK